MTKDFWNLRYAQENYAYGTNPNDFFRQELDKLTPGSLLLPAEGEGRNAVYAAKQGWKVFAYDQSTEGKKKALQLANLHQVSIDYQIHDSVELPYPKSGFDVIALIFAHFDAASKADIHRSLLPLLKPGGKIILEAFSKSHIRYNSANPAVGGPRDEEVLFSKEEIIRDFTILNTVLIEEVEVRLAEGEFHRGIGSVIRYIGHLPI